MTAAVHVCRPNQIALRRIATCPTCKRRRRFSAIDAAWYGPIWTCCGCGDSWGEGERMPRPFCRGWRKQATDRARRTWQHGVRIGSPAHREFIHAELSTT
jgi:hypothetical protein